MVIHFESLHREVRNLVAGADHALDLYAPFVSIKAFDEIIAAKKPGAVVSLVTTWRLEDLASGISDINLYQYCKDKGFYLFLNQKLHLKSYLSDYKTLLTGSANLTGAGLGLHSRHNYETLVGFNEADQGYLVFLSKVKKDAILVNDAVFKAFDENLLKMKSRIQTALTDLDQAQQDIDRLLITQKHFLISALPMSRSIETLFEVLNGKELDDFESMATARHDIANYDLADRTYSSLTEFQSVLKSKFFDHPFITALCEFISEQRRFGAIKEWVQNNCTDVPVPSRRDLTGNVQVLYSWLVDLGPDRFEVTQPRHSQLIGPRKRDT